jgi:hypothetical protein
MCMYIIAYNRNDKRIMSYHVNAIMLISYCRMLYNEIWYCKTIYCVLCYYGQRNGILQWNYKGIGCQNGFECIYGIIKMTRITIVQYAIVLRRERYCEGTRI